MDIRSRDLTNMKYNSTLYEPMISDMDRIVITRWRLSSHDLYIENGRYERPKISREDRKCLICNILEDESHALFFCDAHYLIRIEYHALLQNYNTIKAILNPETAEDIKTIASYILKIENNMKCLKMIQ